VNKIFPIALSIVVIYLASALVLWLLTFIGPVDAAVEGFISRAGGSVWFAAGGVLGAFCMIAGLGLLALWAIAKDVLAKIGTAFLALSNR